jgi:DNA-binding MarR family transcriptional regulator
VKVLLMLLDGPAMLREIAEANQIDAPCTTVIVDKLENPGLVERTAHPDGHRRKLVNLTEAGQEAVERAKRIFSQPPVGLAALPPADLDLLEEILNRLAAPSPKRGSRRVANGRSDPGGRRPARRARGPSLLNSEPIRLHLQGRCQR